MSYFTVDAKNFEEVINTVMKFSDGSEAEKIINEYLSNEGGDSIKEEIQALLPVSGRRWKGKKSAAKSTDPFKKTPENLAVKVHTKGAYHYLYFPDDGSNTEKHFGNQQFMFYGAVESQEEIINEVVNRLIEKLEET